ncbi:hypothetical protein HanPI659440_Chr15g0615371 [Helianthus annuus]|nr:hypothetical protein HanPI659440_Chr15g0615371 [Helianthus annuus]
MTFSSNLLLTKCNILDHEVWWCLGWGLGLGGMSLVWPLRARHVTLLALLARPTPGFKPTPMGPRPNPSPRGGGLGVFSQPTPQPKPHTPWP